MTDYKATPEDWELQSKWLSDCEDARCLLELRTRVEALEAAAHKHIAERRPKPPSLKEQALEALDEEQAELSIQNYKLIRAVLESLTDKE